MSRPKIVCVVPSIRPESMSKFKVAWAHLFEKHEVVLITVWDGESPQIEVDSNDGLPEQNYSVYDIVDYDRDRDLFCRFTDACRNVGFVHAATLNPDYILTLDDDVMPFDEETAIFDAELDNDPIQSHINVLSKRVPISWVNTAHNNSEYLRGIPYAIRDEAPVMLSHGVWVGTPDFDGETQLKLEKRGGVPYSLPYYVGPIPKGVLWACCGMNLMVKRDALPYLYFAPMGKDSGVKCPKCVGEGGVPDVPGFKCMGCGGLGGNLNRFSDIWMGVFLKREFDRLGWACYTGGSMVYHSRASDAKKNYEQEKLGREWNEAFGQGVPPETVIGTLGKSPEFIQYMISYTDKRKRYTDLIRSLLEKGGGG